MVIVKSELIKQLSSSYPNFLKKDLEKLINIFFEQIRNSLKKGDRVELRGFGAFSVKERQPRIARNPRTGEPVKVGNKSVPFFKTGKELRKRLNAKDSVKNNIIEEIN